MSGFDFTPWLCDLDKLAACALVYKPVKWGQEKVLPPSQGCWGGIRDLIYAKCPMRGQHYANVNHVVIVFWCKYLHFGGLLLFP